MALDGTPVRDRRHLQTRTDIVRVAWALAERDGIAGLSLREVAREVGMRAPSLYTYFASKAAIYDAMFAEGYHALEAHFDLVAFEPADPVASLTASIEAFLDFCTASVARFQLLFTRAVPGWQPSPDAYAVSVATYAAMTARLARLGITEPDDVDLLTALTVGLASQQLANDPGGDRWRRLSRPTAEMYFAHTRRR
ncbi:TetR/AcrR family transcriptional regulator [Egicoccus sp. AB-alg6-2]|uniref:TetR/AcrR family transcriptional regulator n=1 Tax=Egicoccus sp. AB-alg6-2 TaxID=3242692 RepID=UPI00359D6E10